MELLCTCGAINAASPPDACVCHRCGRVWIYERTEFANDWRCVRGPLTATTKKPDEQGTTL